MGDPLNSHTTKKTSPNMDRDLLIAKQTEGLPHSQLTLHPLGALAPCETKRPQACGAELHTDVWVTQVSTAGIPGEGLRILSAPSS